MGMRVIGIIHPSVQESAGAEDEAKGQAGNSDLPDGADQERTQPLLPHVGNVGPQSDSRKRQQKGPTGKIRQTSDLRGGKDFCRRHAEIRRKPRTNLGNFCHRNAPLLRTLIVCPLRAQ